MAIVHIICSFDYSARGPFLSHSCETLSANPGSNHRAPSEDRNGQIDNSSSMLYVISFA